MKKQKNSQQIAVAVERRYRLVARGNGVVVVVSRPVVLRRVPPGVVGELEPIMMAAADSFLAEAVVGFMKLSDADAVDRAVLTVVDPVDAVDESGRRGLDRAAVVAVMLGVEVADRPLEVREDDRLRFSFDPMA